MQMKLARPVEHPAQCDGWSKRRGDEDSRDKPLTVIATIRNRMLRIANVGTDWQSR